MVWGGVGWRGVPWRAVVGAAVDTHSSLTALPHLHTTRLSALAEALRDDGLEASHLLLLDVDLANADWAALHEEQARLPRDAVAELGLDRLEQRVVLVVILCARSQAGRLGRRTTY